MRIVSSRGIQWRWGMAGEKEHTAFCHNQVRAFSAAFKALLLHLSQIGHFVPQWFMPLLSGSQSASNI